MPHEYNLQRFLDAQAEDYPTALAEIKNGKKRSHWMWYIFPQVQGLGLSETSRYYAIQNLAEATAYLQHPILGKRLVEISESLLNLPSANANAIFGSPDDMKLQSCMTLFATAVSSNPVFQKVLDKFFAGRKDEKTIAILKKAL